MSHKGNSMSHQQVAKITELEYEGLSAIFRSDYTEGSGITGHDVVGAHGWTFGAVDVYMRATGRDEQSAGGVLASLAKKGLVEFESYEEPSDIVILTEAGFAAWHVAAVEGTA